MKIPKSKKITDHDSKCFHYCLSLVFLLFLCLLSFSTSSCSKDDPEPDLVPITMTGENTMGFYVDGVPYNKKGIKNLGNPNGVFWGKYEDGKIEIAGGGGDPYGYLRISFYEVQSKNIYLISTLSPNSGLGEFFDVAPLGVSEYFTNEFNTGTFEILRLDDHIISGTFDIHLQDSGTGKIVHLTDGRFDIKR